MTADATDLEYVRRRLSRVFANRSVLPIHGIQYRLSEVGRARFDARELAGALNALPEYQRFSKKEYGGFIADPELSTRQADALAKTALRTLRQIAAIDHDRLVKHLSDHLATTLGNSTVTDLAMEAMPTTLAAGVALSRSSTIVESTGPLERRTLCWLTHELPWIYPDDPRVWRLLISAARENASALIVARKVAPATFAVCKALGATALQYHLPYLPTPDSKLANSADRIGWPPFAALEYWTEHPVIDFARNNGALLRARGREALTPKIESAILVAAERGFDRDSVVPLGALLEWAESADLLIPETWFEGVKRWDQHDHQDRLEESRVADTAPPRSAATEVGEGRKSHVIRGPSIAADVDASTFEELSKRAVSEVVRTMD